MNSTTDHGLFFIIKEKKKGDGSISDGSLRRQAKPPGDRSSAVCPNYLTNLLPPAGLTRLGWVRFDSAQVGLRAFTDACNNRRPCVANNVERGNDTPDLDFDVRGLNFFVLFPALSFRTFIFK